MNTTLSYLRSTVETAFFCLSADRSSVSQKQHRLSLNTPHRISSLLCASIVCILLASCTLSTETYTEADIIGRWEAPSQDVMEDCEIENPKIVFVFTHETCTVVTDSVDSDGDGIFELVEVNYGKWGYTYDEGNNVTEDELMDRSAEGAYHRNGWFGWSISGKTIDTNQLTSVGNAVTPKAYTIVSINNGIMVMKEGLITHTLTKK